MKKKLIVIVLALVLALASFAACAQKPAEPKIVTGKSYATVHGAGYVGEATVTLKDGVVTSATLDEACYPTYVQAPATVTGEDVVETKVTSPGNEVDVRYYKTVKFGSTTVVYDLTKNTYMVGTQTWLEWLQTEANAQSYFEAVVANKVAVVVGGKEDLTVLTAKALLKSQNGYGGTNFNWAKNAKATTDYVVKYGFAVASSLTKNADTKIWVDSNGVATGATWTDMNPTKETINYKSYIKLLIDANTKAEALAK